MTDMEFARRLISRLAVLRCEVEPHRHLMRARHVVLAVIGCTAVLLASQQCAGQSSTRLDAAIARDPLPDQGAR